jgi:anion-transporting  ArsA/GET3 family ATPase
MDRFSKNPLKGKYLTQFGSYRALDLRGKLRNDLPMSNSTTLPGKKHVFPQEKGDGPSGQIPKNSPKISLVSGKGGVGKSCVAAALALKRANSGKKTLLVELAEDSFYRYFFDNPKIGFLPTKISENLEVASWDADSCLRDYVVHLVKMESIYRLFFENKVMSRFIEIAPGLRELSLLGKMTSGIRGIGPKFDYDCVIVDSYSTGHTLALLRAPKSMSDVITKGPMGTQSKEISGLLKDPTIFQYVVVTLPEDLPVIEGIELYEKCHTMTGIEPVMIVNKFLDYNVSDQEIQSAAKDKECDLTLFAQYLQEKRRVQIETLDKLKKKNLKFASLPMITNSKSSLELISNLGSHFEA